MSFLESPSRHTRTARTSRDICRDSVAIERPMPTGHRWVAPACVLIGLFVLVLIEATL